MIRASHDAAHRKTVAALRRQIKALEAPETAAGKQARKEARKARQKAIGKPAQGQRQPRVRDPGFLAWLRRLPCVAGAVEGGCEGPIQAAHIRFSDHAKGRVNSGMQAKPDDSWCLALCRRHHLDDQHQMSERKFYERLGIEPGDLAIALHAAYLADEDGAAVIQRFANEATR